MKTRFLSFIILALAATHAWADWVIVEKSTRELSTKFKGDKVPGNAVQESVVTMKIKGDQIRVDMGENTSVILGAEGMTMIMHKQKMIMKTDMASLKAMIEKAGHSVSGQPPAKPVATGQKEKVGEWDTEIYTWEGTMAKGRFWVAKDFPKHAEISAVQDKIGKLMGGATAGLAPQASDFNGMVVKSEQTMMGQKSNTQLISAKEETVDPKEFVPPADYKEMKRPGAPK